MPHRHHRQFVALVALFIGLGLTSALAAEESTKKNYGNVIGIDLGTTFSCVGVVQKGHVVIIQNDLGSRITPSYIAFVNGTRLVGEGAKNQAANNPENTLYDVKRIIGRRFNEPTVQHDIKNYPYKVVENDEGRPAIVVTHAGKKQQFLPEEISALVLKKMKETAEAYLGTPVTHAVVTVPAYFNDAQRSATKVAGRIAGLEVLRIINEPTAAALAYGLDKKDKEKPKDKKVVVYDLGGGTFDVSVLNIDDGVFEVVATNGDTHLGGEDFDQRVMNHFIKIVQKKYDKDITKDPRALHKLKREVENAKIRLSEVFQTKLEIDNLAEGIETFSETLTRARFEDLNQDLFKKTLGPVKKALEDAKATVDSIDEVVLVGGSTRIPKVRALLKEFFGQKKIHTDINPDEAIAYGAAVQGCQLSPGSCETQDMILLDVTPLTLGTEDEDGVMVKIIDRNTVIPTKKTSPFTTVEDNQPSVLFRVYEGERSIAKYNHLLGDFSLRVPPAPKGVPEIRVTFEIDVNGILHCSAKDVATGNSAAVKIDDTRKQHTEDDIKDLVKRASEAAEEDRKFLERVEARQELDQYASSIKSALSTFKSKLKKSERTELEQQVGKVLTWLRHNKEREADIYRKKKQALEDIVNPILGRLYQQSKEGRGGEGASDDDKKKRTAIFSDNDAPANDLDHEPKKSGEFDPQLDGVKEDEVAIGKVDKKEDKEEKKKGGDK